MSPIKWVAMIIGSLFILSGTVLRIYKPDSKLAEKRTRIAAGWWLAMFLAWLFMIITLEFLDKL
jgi:hypothetical protein